MFPLGLVLAAWCTLAVVLGAAGVTARQQPPLPQVVILVLTLGSLAACRFAAPVRERVLALDLRWLVAVHVTRFVGLWFLLAQGPDLAPSWAVPAGVGDLAVAACTPFLLGSSAPRSARQRRLWLLWNAYGLLDILFVVITAARTALQEPGSMAALLRLPLCLLPTFVVPLILVSHALLFVRLRAAVDQRARPGFLPTT
jgi:hypothetical protein